MIALRIGAILLIIAGTVGLVYGKFSYGKEGSTTSLGPIEFTVKQRETINIPVWAGAGAIAVGSLLLLVSKRSRRS